MINIGASKESVIEARISIMEILGSSEAEKVKITALETLAKLCMVNCTISGCTFYGGEKCQPSEK